MMFERKFILKHIAILKKDGYQPLRKQDELIAKSLDKSVAARTIGNLLFYKKNHNEKVHEKIWKCYSKSIAFAPNNSEELACGYAIRSAFLLHLTKYKECLLDVDRALKITESYALKAKLYCRQAKCFVALQDGTQNNSLEKAKYWLNKVNSSEVAEKLNKILQSTIKAVEENIPDTVEKEKKNDIFCDNNSVDIRYNDKFGRFLVATRDIKPGEFVCVENFYTTCVNRSKLHAYWSHCLKISRCTIPCNHCAYYMYCSEDCEDDAWEKYHHIDCRSGFIKSVDVKRDHTEMSLRSFIMGLKEAGSFEKLKELVNTVESFSDKRTKGFSKDGKCSSDSFKSLLSLQYSNDEKMVRELACIAIRAAIVLTKDSNLFDDVFPTTADYCMHMQHKDFIFISLLKIYLIPIPNEPCFSNRYKTHYFAQVTHINRGCTVSEDYTQCQRDCCLRGIGLSLLTSLINHSCDSNVDKFCTDDGRIVYYAVKPIKAHSQIFSSYKYQFLKAPKAIRQSFLYDSYGFTCDCLPCKQNWPIGNLLSKIAEALPLSSQTLLSNYDELLSTTQLFDVDTRNSRKFIKTFAKALAKVYKYTTGPSPAFESFRLQLIMMIENRYCSILKIPQICKNL